MSVLLEIDAGVPTALGFLTPSRITGAGSCSEQIAFAAFDAFGNPSAPAAPANVTVTVSPDAGVELFSNACTTALSGPVVLGPSANRGVVHLRAQNSGVLRLYLTGALQPAVQLQQIEP